MDRFMKLSTYIISALMLAVAFTSSVTAQETTKTETEIQSVIRDQISAFQAQDYERAFSHAAPTIKQIFKNTDNFISMVKNGYAAIYNPDSYTFSRNLTQGDTFYQEVLITDQNGKQWQAVYTLKQVEDVWKITGVKMDPHQGTST